APAGGGRVGIAVGLLGDDLLADVAAVAPGTNEVLVFRGTGGGVAAPDRYPSGAGQPVAVVIGDFVGDRLPALAVGHRDGTLTFLEGLPGGRFAPRPALTVTGLGTITGLVTADLDGDGDPDLAVSGTDRVTVLKRDNDPLTTSPLVNGDFAA